MGCSTQTAKSDISDWPGQANTLGSASPEIDAALRRHYTDFRHFLLRRVTDPSTADDVLQNFCIRVMQSRTELRDAKSALGWLYTVLRSVLIDHYRKETRRRRGENGYAVEAAILSEDVVSSESSDSICSCVNGLTSELRSDHAEILRRIDFDGELRERVSSELGITPQNLRVRLHRARAALKNALHGHCGACCETGFRDCYCDKGCTHPA